jgi:hypothetical protein
MKSEQPGPVEYVQGRVDALRRYLTTRVQPEQPREIAHEGDSVRITLRESRSNKWTEIVIGTARLCWLAVVGVALVAVLIVVLGVPLPERFLGMEIPRDVDPNSIDDPMFARILAAFLALGLLALIFEWIRSIKGWLHSIFGCDIIELETRDWRVTRNAGPFRATQAFDPAAGWIVTVGPSLRNSALAATLGRKAIVVTDFGTSAERTWIRDEIRKRFPPAVPNGALPAGYSSRSAEGGGAIVTRDGVRIFTKTSWHVAPNFFERRIHILGFRHTSRITDAAVQLTFDGPYSRSGKFRLELHEKAGRSIQLATTPVPIVDLLALCEFLGRETGWPLEVAAEAWE